MRRGIALFAAAAVVAASLPFLRDQDATLAQVLTKAKIAVTAPDDGDVRTGDVDPPALTDVALAHIDDREEVITAPAHGTRVAELTLDPMYQRAATSILRRGNVYEAAVVMTEVATGRVLVWSSYNHGRPRDLAAAPIGPSASLFKIVTGTALVEAGVPLSQKHCYRGGRSGITARLLEPDERRDKYCATLGMAMGRSLNVVFGRLAQKHLDPDGLETVARRLGYGRDIPFDVPVTPSAVDMPDDALEFARTAAGFWHTTLSPFQATNLALTVASEGQMVRQRIVARVVEEDGRVIYDAPTERQVLTRVLDERTAWAVARMMEQTVAQGTSFKTFHDRAGRPFIPDVRIAGKTGTLEEKKTGTLFTWWTGFAPADAPEVAISAIVLNRGAWHIKGTHVASDMLRIYFADKGRKGVRFPPGLRGLKRRHATDASAGEES
ncbi:MAG: penicillin-binding transpeptidase domain-containing protein [Myxococcota bacterium]